MDFIQRAHDGLEGECVFCASQKASDAREALVLYKGKSVFVVMNKYPYTNGHLLIIPNRHLAELSELNADEQQEILSLSAKSIEILRENFKAAGFNCGFNFGRAAGAGILDHLHFHIVPRWVGDTNFLPVLSDIRTMPEYLHDTYDRLLPAFQK